MATRDVIAQAKKDNAIYVNLQFTDILGCLKEITVPIQHLSNIVKSGAWFDGSSIEGFARIHESDLYLKPDPDTYAVIPWLSSPEGETIRLICDIYGADDKPYGGECREDGRRSEGPGDRPRFGVRGTLSRNPDIHRPPEEVEKLDEAALRNLPGDGA